MEQQCETVAGHSVAVHSEFCRVGHGSGPGPIERAIWCLSLPQDCLASIFTDFKGPAGKPEPLRIAARAAI